MENSYKIFVVDDEATTRLILESMLGKVYAVETFDSSESCLNRLTTQLPNLFLLDVGLPGMNGYELCRKIKSTPETKSIPVVFISGRDGLEDALAGYDSGGEDYVVKPVEASVLKRKIENLRHIEEDKEALSGQAKASDELATVVLNSLHDYAVLIKFLRTLNECSNYREVVDAVLHILGVFHLNGAVQIRMRNLEKTVSPSGEDWPLEIAVINHVRTLERIFEFHQRAAYNFDHITILINDMPLDDPDLCGRLRDSLAIVAESADAKIQALQSLADNSTMRSEIHNVLQAVEQTVQSYSKQYDQVRYKGSMHTTKLLDDLLRSFARLGMSDQQEEEILAMVKDRSLELIDLYDVAGETHATLEMLSVKLEEILTATEALKKCNS
jgi:CheY-like chemotaxis protein